MRHWGADPVQRNAAVQILALAAYLTVTPGAGMTCLNDPADPEAANSFLVGTGRDATLVDAGWADGKEVPAELAEAVREATAVVTHFHYDHVRQLHKHPRTRLSTTQASRCIDRIDERRCDLSRLLTVFAVPAFEFQGNYTTREALGGDMAALDCAGHSHTDSCFLHEPSRTIFLGDLFYLGPLFTFGPGGSLRGTRDALVQALADGRWDRVAQTHGDCFSTRQDVEKAAAGLADVIAGKVDHAWNFKFMLPLWEYPIATGSVLTLPFARQLDL